MKKNLWYFCFFFLLFNSNALANTEKKLDELWLNSRSNNTVNSTIVLIKDKKYKIKISGSFSPWSAWEWSAGWQGILKEFLPVFPDNEVENSFAAADACYIYACPARRYCDISNFPSLISNFEYSLDGGQNWFKLNTYCREFEKTHTYGFDIKGKNFPISFRLIDYPNSDNYGIFKIEILTPERSSNPEKIGIGTYLSNIEPYKFQDFVLKAQPNQNLLIKVSPTSNISELVLDASFDRLTPMATTGDYSTQDPTARHAYELIISPTASGNYYISVYGRGVEDVGGNFDISVQYVDHYILDVSPRQSGNQGDITLLVKGIGFTNASGVSLEGPGILQPSSIKRISNTILSATFSLNSALAGTYNLVVDFDDGTQEVLLSAFEVIASSTGPKFKAQITAPNNMRFGRTYTAWIDYENIGDSDFKAPLLFVKATGDATVATKSDGPFGNRIQLFAPGTSLISNWLRAGEKGRMPFYFYAIRHGTASFQLSRVEENQSVNWDEHESEMRPQGVDEGEWQQVWPQLKARFGNTWGTYANVLRQAAARYGLRGEQVHDVKKLLRLIIRQIENKPVAAVCGHLYSDETKLLLSGVTVKIRSRDGNLVKETATSYGNLGLFCFEDLPDGDYQIFAEGYYFDDTVNATVSGQQDVLQLSIYGKSLPVAEEIEAPLPDSNPVITTDDSGNVIMVFEHGQELWWGLDRGQGFKEFGRIPGTETASNPVITYAQNLLNNGTEPGLFLAFEYGASPSVIKWSVGNISQDGIAWSQPEQYTSDDASDFSIAVVSGSGKSLLVWLQTNMAIEDDTDVYYGWVNIGSLYPQLSEAIGAMAVVAEETTCGYLKINWNKQFFKSVPFLGGNWGFELKGELCSSQDNCRAQESGEISFSIDVPSLIGLDGSGSMTTKWAPDNDCISYSKFLEAEYDVSLNGKISGEQNINKLPFLNTIADCKATVSGTFGGSANFTWITNWPKWPPNKMSGGLDLGFELSGECSVLAGGLTGLLTGEVTSNFEFRDHRIVFTGYCVTLTLEGTAGWHVGISREKELIKTGINCPEAQALSLSGLEKISDLNTLIIRNYEIHAMDSDEPSIYTETTYEKGIFLGTGNVYEGFPVLGDISNDIYMDRRPSLAMDSTGNIILVWAKDFETRALGSRVYSIWWDGSGWSGMEEITPQTEFNTAASVVFDSSNRAIAVWSNASNQGLDYDTSTVEELLDAQKNTDIMFSIRENNTWSAPQKVAEIPGSDVHSSLAAGPSGQVALSWLNSSSDNTTSLYAVIWNGTSWGSPQIIATSPVLSGNQVIYYVNGNPVIFWYQDIDGNASTTQDLGIYKAIWNGTSWESSRIEVTEPEVTSQAIEGHKLTSMNLIDLIPPEECCEQEPEPEDAEVPEPPDGDLQELDTAETTTVIAIDPNEKTGPMGTGDDHYVKAGDRLEYIIYFENKSDASAPAQEVFVTDCLDTELDWSSLRVEEASFDKEIITNLSERPGLEGRATIEDYRGISKTWWVDIATEIDTNGCFTVTFRTLDPETGQLPEDALAGFLPPEDGSGRGQGYVAFSIASKQGLPDGTELTNKASIVFDSNAPIETNEVRNIINEESGGSGVAGDANGDGKINVLDVISVINKILKPNSNISGDADCNGDGKVNVLDVICIINKILKGA